uniref:Uncharacterized protein n=1 Tax=viral metagenome TaxID=1070528 RepID=A0A6H1ZK00_9ZZZZ
MSEKCQNCGHWGFLCNRRIELIGTGRLEVRLCDACSDKLDELFSSGLVKAMRFIGNIEEKEK